MVSTGIVSIIEAISHSLNANSIHEIVAGTSTHAHKARSIHSINSPYQPANCTINPPYQSTHRINQPTSRSHSIPPSPPPPIFSPVQHGVLQILPSLPRRARRRRPHRQALPLLHPHRHPRPLYSRPRVLVRDHSFKRWYCQEVPLVIDASGHFE